MEQARYEQGLPSVAAGSNSPIERAFRSIGDGIVVVNTDGNVVFANDISSLYTGISPPKALGRCCSQVIRLSDTATGHPLPCPIKATIVSGSGSLHPNYATIEPVVGESCQIQYDLAVLRDGTHLSGVVITIHAAGSEADASRRHTDRLETIARATRDAIWDWDLVSGEVHWNQATAEIFKVEQTTVSTLEWWRSNIHEEDRALYEEELGHLFQSSSSQWSTGYRFCRGDGAYAFVHERGYLLRNAEGKPIRMLGAIMDLSARREAQDQLQQLDSELEHLIQRRTNELAKVNRELGSANKELEAFTYSASHDLRAPVRSILAYTRIIKEDEGAMLTNEGRSNLDRVTAAAKRMEALIEDLLSYSKLSRRELRRESIDLSLMATSVASELRRTYPGVMFAVQPGVRTTADPHLVRVVLENLMENAAKYSSRKDHPLVEFGCRPGPEGDTLFVRDNGVGFEPHYSDRVFTPFERLHGSEFPGTGIGLSNVQRIVQRHGGHVWAQSKTGEGATFSFTLAPRTRQAEAPYLA